MTKTIKTLKVTICGPSDVAKEVEIAKAVISDWNQRNWESTGWGLKTQHWDTDAVPTMAERGQAAINHQLIDNSDIIITILWTRLGTPTGLAESGTEEEITRAMARDIEVMSYFSDLEAPGNLHDKNQAEKLAAFRAKMMKTGLPFKFSSRRQFRDMLERHLDATIRKLLLNSKKEKKPSEPGKNITQKAEGNANIQFAGDGNTLNIRGATSKMPTVTIERLPDHISPADQKRVSDWIKKLAEESTGKPIRELIQEWWGRFYNRFKMASYKELKTGQMPDVETWHRQQINLIKEDRKTTDPQSWRNARYASIKSKIGKMGRTKEEYYPELSDRLNMKKPFTSLTKLSKHDLGRVDGMVKRDYDKWRK